MSGEDALPLLRHLVDVKPTPGAAAEVYGTPASRMVAARFDESSDPTDATGHLWFLLEGSLQFEGLDEDAGVHDLVMGGKPRRGSGLALAYALPQVDADVTPERVRASPDRVRSNQFLPLVESEHVAAALLSIAAGRRMDAGPESERTFIPLRGSGLAFFENETTLPWQPGDVLVVPAGWPVRLWSRGPEDGALLVVQPQRQAPAERRTLASEIRRKRGGNGDA